MIPATVPAVCRSAGGQVASECIGVTVRVGYHPIALYSKTYRCRRVESRKSQISLKSHQVSDDKCMHCRDAVKQAIRLVCRRCTRSPHFDAGRSLYGLRGVARLSGTLMQLMLMLSSCGAITPVIYIRGLGLMSFANLRL